MTRVLRKGKYKLRRINFGEFTLLVLSLKRLFSATGFLPLSLPSTSHSSKFFFILWLSFIMVSFSCIKRGAKSDVDCTVSKRLPVNSYHIPTRPIYQLVLSEFVLMTTIGVGNGPVGPKLRGRYVDMH